ncbi:hypothetical protein HELRODRAFT_185353 [Helobdella robusta]|uniref:Aquaporin n=1 Tax=Helobdella robusta TaxID=6412 RepID=T1FMQ1_HELRO|nr:hypothetical protein HELRODRAFT_185353 [Helobdella robusta]ESO09515.1 hypothetical protein HELRODRAFT_185353 [Helobdella robusta]
MISRVKQLTAKLSEDLQHSKQDLSTLIVWRDVFCELMVTSFLMIMVTLVLITNNVEAYKPGVTHFGIFAGFFVYMLLEGYGNISCVANPMAAFCFYLAGKFSIAKTILFTAAHVTGCICGSVIGYELTPAARLAEPGGAFHAFNPANHGLTVTQSVFVEAILSFNLIFVVLSLHGSELGRPYPILPNLAIGIVIGTSIMAAGTHTGGFMNPLISLGPAFLSHDFKNHWIYWVGPYIGGPPAVYVYKMFVFIKRRNDLMANDVLLESSPRSYISNSVPASDVLAMSIVPNIRTCQSSSSL